MMPKVDTFEGDIANEIKRKEASLTEISAASNNVGNNDDIELPKKTPVFFIAVIVVFVICLLGLGVLAYIYISDSTDTTQPTQQPVTTTAKTPDIKNISPTLSDQIGRYVTRVEKKDQGYILTISEYSPVFAYMTRNEKDYIEELATVFGGMPKATSTAPVQPKIEKTVAPPVQATSTIEEKPVVATTTATSTPKSTSTTKKTGTSKTVAVSSSSITQLSTTTPPEIIPPKPMVIDGPHFEDVTISNQNMRVWISGATTVVYAFVGNNIVLISNSKDGILSLKGGILH